ncbi:hypothetical protein PRIPAC_80220, partial [Pristionchus pacificus]
KTEESKNDQESILDKVRTHYDAAYIIRLQKEREYLSKVDLQRIEHPTEEFFVSNVSAYYGLYGSLIEHAVVIFSNISPVFQDTPILLKSSLFKNFLAKFVMVESFYLSA